MWYACGPGEDHTGFWWGVLKEIDYLEDLGLSGRITLKLIFKTWDRETWTELIWFGIGTGGGRL
jgi:hypothetical protein